MALALGWSSCTRPKADYKSALPGGLASGPRPGMVELHSTQSRLQVGSPRRVGELYSTPAVYCRDRAATTLSEPPGAMKYAPI